MAISVPARRRWWASQRVAADRTGTRTRADAAVDAPTVVRAVVAGALFGSAVVHFGLAPDHFLQSIAGWVQLGLAFAVLLRPSRAVFRLVILADVGIALAWAMSRVVGMPFGDTPWVAQSVHVPDGLAVALEVTAVVGSYQLLRERWRGRALPRRLAVVGGVVLAVVLVGGTSAAVATSLSGGGRSVGAPRASGESAASGAATGSGTNGAPEHVHVAAPAGIEAGNGSSPCEQAGVNVAGSSVDGHGHAGPSPQQAITDPATRATLTAQLEAAREAAARYPTAADAIAAGYRKVTTYIPCIAAHYMNVRLVDGTFDPSQPEMLLYGGNGPDAKIVGLSYYVLGASPPEGFAGPNDDWHQHIGLCVRGGLVVGGTDLTAEQCAARGGVKADGSNAWMVHAWVVPGWESAWGVFSGEHPELGRNPPG